MKLAILGKQGNTWNEGMFGKKIHERGALTQAGIASSGTADSFLRASHVTQG